MNNVTIPVLIDWNSIKDYMAQNDVIQVIRCKDCKHMHEDGVESYCDDSGRYIDGTGFCKWAERREE